MDFSKLSKHELKYMQWSGIPLHSIMLFLALGYGSGAWWHYFGIILIGIYVYGLIYWGLYKRLMLNKEKKETIKFYSLLISYQLIIIGLVILVLIET